MGTGEEEGKTTEDRFLMTTWGFTEKVQGILFDSFRKTR